MKLIKVTTHLENSIVHLNPKYIVSIAKSSDLKYTIIVLNEGSHEGYVLYVKEDVNELLEAIK